MDSLIWTLNFHISNSTHGFYTNKCDKARERILLVSFFGILFVLVQTANGIFLDHFEVDPVAAEVPDIIDSVFDHCRPKEKNSWLLTKHVFQLLPTWVEWSNHTCEKFTSLKTVPMR